jgi:dinuclear metal center protein, YbgI/SA1388 family
MSTILDIFNAIDYFSPFNTQEDWDNSGLLIGDKSAPVNTAVLALDITNAVITEAVNLKASVIITHHPVIFSPLKQILSDSLVYRLISENIAVVCAHTNLDKSKFGINSHLAELLNLNAISPLTFSSDNTPSIGLVGSLPSALSVEDFSLHVKKSLNLPYIRLASASNTISKVAVCSGGGGNLLTYAIKSGADAFVTGDVKLDVILNALHNNITLVDAGHFGTENIIIKPLAEKLSSMLPDVTFITANVNDPVTLV